MVDGSAASRVPVTTRTRAVVFGCVVLLALPALAAAGFHGSLPTAPPDDAASAPSLADRPNLTVVTAQGGAVGDGADSRIVVFDPATGEAIWEHDGYDTYYDVDPLDGSTLLYVGMLPDGRTYAVEHDWRTGRHRRLFRLPYDSHDVDYLGDGEYAYLDGRNDTAVVYDATRDEVVWEYDFRDHYPPESGNGPPGDYSGDYTHLNDVVPVDGGSKFLLSPRNFDRVVLVDRASKEIEWTLGAEDHYGVLNQQHNPTLLSTDPPTVLVADSENDRVVEYRREGGEWRLVWEYRGSLVWPRDADRLPNGNTLIVDSGRAVEVTPDREVVWEAEIPRYLYDVERIRLGDEPGGPSMAEYRGQFDSPRDERDRVLGGPLAGIEDAYAGVYNTAYWVLPWWLGPVEFGLLLPALVVLFAWLDVELERAVSGRVTATLRRLRRAVAPFWGGRRSWARIPPAYRPFVPGIALLSAGALVLPLGIVSRAFVGTGPLDGTVWWNWVPPHVSVALLLSVEGARWLLVAGSRRSGSLARLHAGAATATVVAGFVFVAGGTLSSIDLLALSNAGTLLVFGSVAVFGLLSLVRSPTGAGPERRHRLRGVLNRIVGPAPVRYLAGTGIAAASVFVLGQGLRTATFPLLYLVLAFVLLLDGDRIAARVIAGAGWRPPVRGVLGLVRYAVRPVWLAVAGALVAKMVGAGAMAGAVADVHFLNPITVGVVLFAGSRLGGALSDIAGSDAAVSGTGGLR